jgi:hypothetical protein
MCRSKVNLVPPLVALGLILVVGMESWSRPRPASAEPYHAYVRQIAESIPHEIAGVWVGVDNRQSEDAEKLLKPNVIFGRRYANKETGQVVSVLIVHCKDARNLEGHYPPVCYPSGGQPQISAESAQWKVAGMDVPGMLYKFAGKNAGDAAMMVYNFLILPPKFDKALAKVEDGTYVPDMKGVNRNAWDYMRRYFGAAQVQVVFAGDNVSPEQRQEIFQQMIQAHKPLIEAIRSGAMQ